MSPSYISVADFFDTSKKNYYAMKKRSVSLHSFSHNLMTKM
jgi:hypothetical protein